MKKLKLNLNIIINGFFVAYFSVLVLIEGGLLVTREYFILVLSLLVFLITSGYIIINVSNIRENLDNVEMYQKKLIKMNIIGAVLVIMLIPITFIEVISIIGIFAKYWYITIPIFILALLLCPHLWRWTSKDTDKKIINVTTNGVLNSYLVVLVFLLPFFGLAFVFRW